MADEMPSLVKPAERQKQEAIVQLEQGCQQLGQEKQQLQEMLEQLQQSQSE